MNDPILSQTATVVEEKPATDHRGRWQDAILAGLQGKHVYGGTVDPVVVQRRRAKNKTARRSRRVNRSK